MIIAFSRGFRIVRLPGIDSEIQNTPSLDVISNEELAVAMCQTESIDEPQMLRLPSQMISRKTLDIQKVILVARRERATRILAELSRQALKVEPMHDHWRETHKRLGEERGFSEPILHWSRLAEPVMNNGRFNADKWVLVA